MPDIHSKLILIYDDRELTSGDVCNIVGTRRYGDIIFKRRRLFEHFRDSLPTWAAKCLIRLQNPEDLTALRSTLEACNDNTAVCIVSGRAGFSRGELLAQLIQRLPYAEESFTDRLYKPLFVYLRNAHSLIDQWSAFLANPIHACEISWKTSQRLQSLLPLDLSNTRDFLSFTSGSTATRHFNEVLIDSYHYTKRSIDKQKIQSEYLYYSLVPERMRPWLIETFDFKDEGNQASYKMLRYYLADAALQWVHGAFDQHTFSAFVDRLLFFVSDRSKKPCKKHQSASMAQALFINKLKRRITSFIETKEGICINQLAKSANQQLDLNLLLERYLSLYEHYENYFSYDYSVVGHGDPCLSNVLYDQQRYLLKLIDPKGAMSSEDLWTHPMYDLCKISHSILGDYDFINNGLYSVNFSDKNDLILHLQHTNHENLKKIFTSKIKEQGYDIRIIRLGEASLFLSMLPLHIDFPNKVIAFMLKANQIMDEVENA
jgi:hypothetical protein